MRKPIIAGNWKLNNTTKETVELLTALCRELSDVETVDMVVCPVFTSLTVAQDVLMEKNISLGAQDCYWDDSGAFTGEVAVPMLKDLGVQYVIIGHSERRQYFGETDETVNKKIKAVLAHGLTPIVCVGEVLEDREADKTEDVVGAQLKGSLANLSAAEMSKMIIAYEPVWAIGTGKTATPQQAQDVHAFIRGYLKENFGAETAEVVRIQYGGSVKPDNAKELMACPDIDGALVGGASLKADAFAAIIKNCI